MSDKIKKLEFNLRTIEEGRLGRSEMWSISGGANQCNPLNLVSCATNLMSCGGGSNSKYVGSQCGSGTKGLDGNYTCDNCYWIKVCSSSDALSSCGGGSETFSHSCIFTPSQSWGGGASVTPHEIITELTLHSSLYIGSCEVYTENPVAEDMIVYQNHPNPFSEITTIECYIPQIIESAELQICDVDDILVKTIVITERGTVSIVITAAELSSTGTYTCLLTADGETSNEIQMILE